MEQNVDKCPKCAGTGKIKIHRAAAIKLRGETERDIDKGRIVTETCPECNGSGTRKLNTLSS